MTHHNQTKELTTWFLRLQIKYVPRGKKKEANALVQQASGYEVTKGMFTIRKRSATRDTISNHDESAEQGVVNNQKGERERPTSSSKTKFTSVIDEECARKCMVARARDIRANGDRGGRASDGMPASREESLTVGENSMKKDWRQPIIEYLQKLDHTRDKKIRRQLLKYVMLDGELH
jgi:hypothetical protein